MSISAVIGYVVCLIALGFVVGALFWVADKNGLLDYVKRNPATRARHHRALHRIVRAKFHTRPSAAHRPGAISRRK
jgi:hypothetical protein